MKIVAVDPGVTTGYCFADVLTKLNWSPQQHIDDVDDLWDRIKEFAPRYIICEDFEFRQRSRAGLVLFSVQCIGVLRLYEAKAPQCSMILQKAAQGKGYYTDTQLKRLGFYEKARPHAMDATRHLLHWLTFGAGYSFIEGKHIEEIKGERF